MIALVPAVFPGKDHTACAQQSNAQTIEIYDRLDGPVVARKCYIRSLAQEPVHFTVFNHLHRNLTFLAIDNCMMTPNDPARCECVIGNENKLIFIEIKRVKFTRRDKARSDAVNQLRNCVTLFKERADLSAKTLLAIIAIKAAQSYPAFAANKASARVEFIESLGCDLLEGQEIEFG